MKLYVGTPGWGLIGLAYGNTAGQVNTHNAKVMKGVEDEIQASERECEAKRQSGVLHNFTEWAECANPPMIAAFKSAGLPDMDLIQVYAASRLVIAEKLDKGEMTAAEAQLAAADAKKNVINEMIKRHPPPPPAPTVVVAPQRDEFGLLPAPNPNPGWQQQILQH